MYSDTRVLIIVLAVVGLLSCGCLCLPFGAALSLPVIHRVREAAVKAEADRMARARQRQMAARPRFAPPAPPPPPVFRNSPPADPFPSEFRLPPPPHEGTSLPPVGMGKSAAERQGGLGSLDETQRKTIYRSATFHERMQVPLIEQMRMRRERGLDASHLERMLADRAQRHVERLDQLCERHSITRPELDQIIAEGKRKGW